MLQVFEKDGKLGFLHSTVEAFETFLKVPGTVTGKGSHVRDSIDLKRIMMIAVVSVIPAAIFGIWNVGYQHSLAMGISGAHVWSNFWFGFWRVLPLYVVTFLVGLTIEFGAAQIRNEEVNEGFLMSGMLIPLIVPIDVPLWMLAIAVAFAIFFGKEVFGGTGMNIWNPALLARVFLYLSYPGCMTGSGSWIAFRKSETMIDAATGATPLSFIGDGFDAITHCGAQYGTSFWTLFWGGVPGSVGETSVLAILLGAAILIYTGVASWKIMASSIGGALFVGWLAQLCGATDIPAIYQLVMGGFAFGTVFMATDPVTSAQTECGKWIYGFLIGAICVLIRVFNPGYVEGMMFAILLGNTFAPLIDHLVFERHLARKYKPVKTANR